MIEAGCSLKVDDLGRIDEIVDRIIAVDAAELLHLKRMNELRSAAAVIPYRRVRSILKILIVQRGMRWMCSIVEDREITPDRKTLLHFINLGHLAGSVSGEEVCSEDCVEPDCVIGRDSVVDKELFECFRKLIVCQTIGEDLFELALHCIDEALVLDPANLKGFLLEKLQGEIGSKIE